MPITTNRKPPAADPEKIRLAIERTRKQMGLPPIDRTATAERAREMMLRDGVRPEDNILSSEILRTRYPEDYE